MSAAALQAATVLLGGRTRPWRCGHELEDAPTVHYRIDQCLGEI